MRRSLPFTKLFLSFQVLYSLLNLIYIRYILHIILHDLFLFRHYIRHENLSYTH
jgi:hypothetical protein